MSWLNYVEKLYALFIWGLKHEKGRTTECWRLKIFRTFFSIPFMKISFALYLIIYVTTASGLLHFSTCSEARANVEATTKKKLRKNKKHWIFLAGYDGTWDQQCWSCIKYLWGSLCSWANSSRHMLFLPNAILTDQHLAGITHQALQNPRLYAFPNW